jgi:DNA-binding CsgD family transcriptional regulator/sugar-specific transcriptional regulator TrmB
VASPGSSELWNALGLTTDEVAVYTSLLHDPGASADVRAVRVGVSADRVTACVNTLVDRGLAHRRGDEVRPARPSAALLSLARARRAALENAESVASELDEVFGAGSAYTGADELFEVIRGGPAILDRLRHLVESAVRGIDSIDTPPYVSGPDPTLHDAETAAVERGVRIRTIVDFSALDDPLHVRDVLRSVEEGQEVRLSAALRTKMIVVDGERVLIPLAVDVRFGEPHVAIIGHREIVDALAGYFDRLFETAVPLDPIAGAPVSQGSGQVFSPQEERLLQLLSSGMTDGAIAAYLGLSERTLRRRIGTLQDRLGARGRYQLGQLVERARMAADPSRRG